MRVSKAAAKHPAASSSPRGSPSARHKKPITPPMSPTDGYTSDDDKLEGSFLLVTGEEDDSSTVGSSMRDSINDIFSDSSNEEHRHDPWEGSTTGSESEPTELQHADLHSTEESDGILLASPDIGSYIDAEATATYSDMGDSRSTIHRGLQSLSSSQVRLIMPDPVSSFLTSSDGSTPSASYGNLKQIPDMPTRINKDGKRGIDRSWLEASSRLWNVAPEVQAVKADSKTGRPRMADEAGPYEILASQDLEKEAEGSMDTEGSPKVKGATEKPPSVVARGGRWLDIQQLRAVLANTNLAGIRRLAKRWSTSISMLALALSLSLALIHSFATSAAEQSLSTSVPVVPQAVIPTILSGGRTVSIWDRLSSSVEVSTTLSTTSDQSVPTTRIPDLHLIKQALSTLSTFPLKVPETKKSKDAPEVKLTKVAAGSSARKRKASTLSSDHACCALSVRKSDSAVALQAVPTHPAANDTTWARAIRRKITRQTNDSTTGNQTANQTRVAEPCACTPSQHTRSDVMSHLIRSLHPVQRQLASASHTLATIYAPVKAELRRDYAELQALGRSVAEATSTLAEFIIRRAARGLGISRQAMERATRGLRSYLPPLPSPHVPHIDTQALVKARQSIDHLSELVEDQAASLAEFVEEQSAMIHEKSIDSLRQAKRGLDKVIREARRVVGDAQGDQEIVKEPLPKTMRRKEAASPFNLLAKERVRMVNREMRSKRRVQRGGTRRDEGTRIKVEQRTRGRKIWDAIHHGAMALVV